MTSLLVNGGQLVFVTLILASIVAGDELDNLRVPDEPIEDIILPPQLNVPRTVKVSYIKDHYHPLVALRQSPIRPLTPTNLLDIKLWLHFIFDASFSYTKQFTTSIFTANGRPLRVIALPSIENCTRERLQRQESLVGGWDACQSFTPAIFSRFYERAESWQCDVVHTSYDNRCLVVGPLPSGNTMADRVMNNVEVTLVTKQDTDTRFITLMALGVLMFKFRYSLTENPLLRFLLCFLFGLLLLALLVVVYAINFVFPQSTIGKLGFLGFFGIGGMTGIAQGLLAAAIDNLRILLQKDVVIQGGVVILSLIIALFVHLTSFGARFGELLRVSVPIATLLCFGTALYINPEFFALATAAILTWSIVMAPPDPEPMSVWDRVLSILGLGALPNRNSSSVRFSSAAFPSRATGASARASSGGGGFFGRFSSAVATEAAGAFSARSSYSSDYSGRRSSLQTYDADDGDPEEEVPASARQEVKYQRPIAVGFSGSRQVKLEKYRQVGNDTTQKELQKLAEYIRRNPQSIKNTMSPNNLYQFAGDQDDEYFDDDLY